MRRSWLTRLWILALGGGALLDCAAGGGLDSAATGGVAGSPDASAGRQGSAGDSGSGGVAATGGSAGTIGASGAGMGGGGTGGSAGAGATAGAAGAGGTNPCAGVSCNTPPANTCADANNLLSYSPVGVCSEANCIYPTGLVGCPGGCSAGACIGDPCIGVTCATPPASTCDDATHLRVYDSAGACSNGTCSYGSHLEFCTFSCAANVCNGDLCVGKACNTPPASYCADTTRLVVHDTNGTCSAGACSYTSHSESCNFGCASGQCTGDPCAGVSCATPPASYCVGSNTVRRFAAAGTCSNGSCSYTPADSPCPFGCVAGQCKDCSINSDCGSGRWCNSGTCATCNNDQHCGASCTACLAPTPRCLDQGSTSSCVECLTSGDCGSALSCNANHTCGTAGCALPAESCTTGSQNGDGCSSARIIGRTAAASVNGYSASRTNCPAMDRFNDSTSCADSGSDHAYRVYLRAGETINVTMTTAASCGGGTWYGTLKIFSNGGCSDTACTTKVYCNANSANMSTAYTAPQDGWFIIVADTPSTSNGGVYALTVRLTCNVGGCECS